MESRTGSEFSFGRSARDVSALPSLAPDLVRSYQQPFHLRIHPDKWEFVNGAWQLQVERCHLRPGVGGVGGQERDLDSYDDTALLQQWSRYGDKRWAAIPNGDNRLRGIFGETGNFLRRVEVQTVDSNGHHRIGPVIIAAWEKVTDVGTIENDDALLAEYSAKLAKSVLNIDGPSALAKQAVTTRYAKILSQLEATSQRGRDGGTTSLKKRINKIRRILAAITGDTGYTDELFDLGAGRGRSSKKAEPSREKAEPPLSKEEQLKALLAQFTPEQIAALISPKEEPTPVVKKTEKKP